MANEIEAPERIWLPREDAAYVPNAAFYNSKDNEDDTEYIRADLVAAAIATERGEATERMKQACITKVEAHVDCELHPRLVREAVIGYHVAAVTIVEELKAITLPEQNQE